MKKTLENTCECKLKTRQFTEHHKYKVIWEIMADIMLDRILQEELDYLMEDDVT